LKGGGGGLGRLEAGIAAGTAGAAGAAAAAGKLQGGGAGAAGGGWAGAVACGDAGMVPTGGCALTGQGKQGLGSAAAVVVGVAWIRVWQKHLSGQGGVRGQPCAALRLRRWLLLLLLGVAMSGEDAVVAVV